MGFEMVDHDDIAALERRHQALFNIGKEISAVMGPSTTSGATIAS
jgi:hypothetical protein